VKQGADKLNEMLKLTNGERRVPVIVENDDIQIGYAGGS
jgi:hypothetical protein